MAKKTSKTDFRNAAETPQIPKRNYSHQEVVRRIDAYASVAKTGKQRIETLTIKNNYLQNKKKTIQDRNRQDVYFAQGFQRGLHTNEDRQRVDHARKAEDQQRQNRVMQDAGSYYHRNYSLSRSFKAQTEKSKAKPMDKG